MPSFDIVKTSAPKKSFRVQSVVDRFDLPSEKIQERFTGELNLGDDWQIGLIIGASGTGKTTIAKHVFGDDYCGDFAYSAEAVIDDLAKEQSVENVTKTLNAVGFSSPPSWLKPYAVLSNGEKMRVDLANAILSDKTRIVFDEFTSVVDRQVARIGSYACQKAIRRTKKQFIAVTCHYDVEDWLMPDWVFCTDQMKVVYEKRRYLQRPQLRLQIYETSHKSRYWNMFARYHYLSHSHNNAARCFVATIDDHLAAFCSVLHFPHPTTKNIKRIHRLVVLPDYQGCGIGREVLNRVSSLYPKNRIRITTSQPALIMGLKNDKHWMLKSKSRKSSHDGLNGVGQFGSANRITTSWEFYGFDSKS
jgi:ABC-type Mn2+/Zn2+ transport system ATPase subunit/predicted acetyltransferase